MKNPAEFNIYALVSGLNKLFVGFLVPANLQQRVEVL